MGPLVGLQSSARGPPLPLEQRGLEGQQAQPQPKGYTASRLGRSSQPPSHSCIGEGRPPSHLLRPGSLGAKDCPACLPFNPGAGGSQGTQLLALRGRCPTQPGSPLYPDRCPAQPCPASLLPPQQQPLEKRRWRWASGLVALSRVALPSAPAQSCKGRHRKRSLAIVLIALGQPGKAHKKGSPKASRGWGGSSAADSAGGRCQHLWLTL